MGRKRRRGTCFALVATAAALAVTPALAEANYVYWTNQNETTIGRAKLNGEGANNSFMTGLNQPMGIATDSKYLYWMQGDSTNATIGRANLDGTNPNPNFIPHQAGMDAGAGIVITPNNGIYWGNRLNTIGHANLDGSNADPDFINHAGSFTCGLTANANFIYWGLTTGANEIGRATLAGAGIDNTFAGSNVYCGLAMDNTYIYYGSNASNSIGRAPIGGGAGDPTFIPNASSPGNDPCGMGITPEYLFWGNTPETAIGRANVNGTGVSPTLIDGATNPCLVTAAPPNKVTVNSIKKNKKKGTASIDAKVPGPGQVELTTIPLGASEAASPVKNVGLTLTAAGSFKVPVKPQGKTSKRLKKKGKAKVTVYVNFTPSGVAGVTNSQKQVVQLVKKLKKKKKGK